MGTPEVQEYDKCSWHSYPIPQADVTMEEAAIQCKTEFRQLEGLGTLSSPDQMKGVFSEVVTAHHEAYKLTGYIHCNLETHNMTFYRDEGKLTGILFDPEFTIKERELRKEFTREVPSTDGPPRYAKIPTIHPLGRGQRFGSIQLLDGSAEECRYRHDLESFFWILLHFLVSFRPPPADFRSAKGSITRRWGDLKPDELADEKEGFFAHLHWYKGEMYGPEKEAQRELLTWVYRLYKGWRRLVRRELGLMDETTLEVIDGVVHQMVADERDGGASEDDDEDEEGEGVSVPAEGGWRYVWNRSRKDERRRDTVMNYETFMAAIHSDKVESISKDERHYQDVSDRIDKSRTELVWETMNRTEEADIAQNDGHDSASSVA